MLTIKRRPGSLTYMSVDNKRAAMTIVRSVSNFEIEVFCESLDIHTGEYISEKRVLSYNKVSLIASLHISFALIIKRPQGVQYKCSFVVEDNVSIYRDNIKDARHAVNQIINDLEGQNKNA